MGLGVTVLSRKRAGQNYNEDSELRGATVFKSFQVLCNTARCNGKNSENRDATRKVAMVKIANIGVQLLTFGLVVWLITVVAMVKIVRSCNGKNSKDRVATN